MKASKPLEYIYKTEKITAYQSFFSPTSAFVAGKNCKRTSFALSLFLIFTRFFPGHFGCSIENAYRHSTKKFESSFERKLMHDAHAKCICIRMRICVFHSMHSNYCNNPRWYPCYGVTVLLDAFLLHRRIQSLIGSTLLTATFVRKKTTFEHSEACTWNLMRTQIPFWLHYSRTRTGEKKSGINKWSGLASQRVLFSILFQIFIRQQCAEKSRSWKKWTNCLIPMDVTWLLLMLTAFQRPQFKITPQRKNRAKYFRGTPKWIPEFSWYRQHFDRKEMKIQMLSRTQFNETFCKSNCLKSKLIFFGCRFIKWNSLIVYIKMKCTKNERSWTFSIEPVVRKLSALSFAFPIQRNAMYFM